MSLAPPMPRTTRRAQLLLGIGVLGLLALLLAAPTVLLQGVGPITTWSACPDYVERCTDRYAETARATVLVCAILAPVLAVATAAAVVALLVQHRRAWSAGLIGAFLVLLAVAVRVEVATVNAAWI